MAASDLLICSDDIPPGKCVLYHRDMLKNDTVGSADFARLKQEVQDLSYMVFIITEVLSASILLIFVLILVLAWRLKREKRRAAAQQSQQTFFNRAFLPDEESGHRLSNMQYTYSQDVKIPL
ncbi:uncharacterized protein [Periplaneta americana]|uniref:uncharacterized protein n=1 Tax=Periplaneta americana TaxID=6978 RepID=UPI0037E82D3F